MRRSKRHAILGSVTALATPPTTPRDTPKPNKAIKRMMLLGFVLALTCQLLPESYQVLCTQIAHICTGGFP